MVSLDELTNIEGVAVAGRFAMDGRCTDHRANVDMSQEKADKAGQYIATVTMMFNTLADAFSKESQMSWTPQKGWTYSGGDWTVVVWGDVGVFCQTETTDMHKLFQVLETSETEVKTGV